MKSTLFVILCTSALLAAGCQEENIVQLGNQAGTDKDSTGSSKPGKTPGSEKDNQDGQSSDASGSDGSDKNPAENDDPALDPSIPRDIVGGLESSLEFIECIDDPIPLCEKDDVISCRNGHYYIDEICSQNDVNKVCVDSVGCRMCSPGKSYCKGNDVYECSDDGTKETLKQKCDSVCMNGECNDNCSAESKFIYLVDDTYNLIRFNPGAKDKKYLTVLFHLDCKSHSTPFSMAVDRDANAWVLYNDSTIYKVNIKDQSCSKVIKVNETSWGLDLFGMAFVSETIGSDNDILFIGGTEGGRFGRIDPKTMKYTPLAPFPSNYEQTPELTGTGNAQLFSFAPGTHTQQITEIDKTTGNVIKNYTVPGPGHSTSAWAFAHWGGYYFTMQTNGGRNQIYRFDPNTEEFDLFLSNTPYRVVGAGVSTCAPTEVVN